MSDTKKIIIVDDSIIMRSRIKQVLEPLDFLEIQEADCGAKLFELLEVDSNIDLITLDYNMPELNGLEILQMIKDKGLAIPTIMVTTENEKDIILEAMTLGLKDYFIKPLEEDVVLPKMLKILNIEESAS